MTPALRKQLKPLLDQVQANPRLQAGLALAVLLVLGWLFLVLGDLRKAEVQRLEQARERYIQVRQLSGQQVWLQRAAAARQLVRKLEAEIPQAASPGLAQASFQGWLKPIVDGQGVPLRMDMQAPARVEAQPGIVRISATVSGGMDPQRVWQMIHRIEAGAALATIPVLTVRSDGANKTFSLTVQGFYRVPAQQIAGDGT
jgi:hypothetical protein